MSAAQKRSVSAYERLLALPELFRGADLTVRFGWTSKTASQYLYLWKRRGLVRGLGGHSDVFANLLRNPDPDWEAAAHMAMPTAVIVGVEALRRATWTTQIPARPDLAVPREGPAYQVEPYRVRRRTRAWFSRVEPGIVRQQGSPLPVLHPAWALADMLQRDACPLDPDDIDWEGLGPDDEAAWKTAAAALKAPGFGPLPAGEVAA